MKFHEQRIRQRLKNDFRHYAEKCLKIRSKPGRIEPFLLNTAQLCLHAELERQKRETGRVRALVLKGRQQGCSTYVQGRYYWKVTHGRGTRAFILTHLEEASKNIYAIVKRFHDHCPSPVRPHTSLSNARELVFDRLDSGYHVGTARSSGVGRSSTVQYFHGSEVAYWPSAEEHMAGVLQAVPDTAGSEVVLESTAAGRGNLFHHLCDEAEKGRNGFRFIFIPWHWQTEYRQQVPMGSVFEPTADEVDVQRLLGLDDAQMLWRRGKIGELGGLNAFRREYPASPAEAFGADREGALWRREDLERNRRRPDDMPALQRVVVAVDPAVTAEKNSDETGIVVAALGADGHVYVLEDLSGRFTPAEWAARAVAAYHRHRADRVVAEANQGGDLVAYTLKTADATVPCKLVHASRGKVARAEPVAALDEQGRIHHVGVFAALEDQLCRFDPALDMRSPDRADARIWAVTELLLSRTPATPRVWA